MEQPRKSSARTFLRLSMPVAAQNARSVPCWHAVGKVQGVIASLRVAQIAHELADHFGWQRASEKVKKQRFSQQKALKQKRRQKLEEKILELYADQLPRTALMKAATRSAPKVLVAVRRNQGQTSPASMQCSGCTRTCVESSAAVQQHCTCLQTKRAPKRMKSGGVGQVTPHERAAAPEPHSAVDGVQVCCTLRLSEWRIRRRVVHQNSSKQALV